MRHTVAENVYVFGKFASGDTVTLALYQASDSSIVPLTSASCTHLVQGVFKWNSSNITTVPTTFTEYLWIMDNSTYTQYGKIVLGGYPDDVKTQTDKMGFTGNDIKATLDSEEVDIGKVKGGSVVSIADFKAAGFATENPPSQTLDDYKATGFAIPGEYDTYMGYIPTDLDEVPTSGELNSIHGAGSWETATGFATENPPSQVLNDYKATGFSVSGEYNVQLSNLQTDTTFLRHEAEGKWEIVGNQMVFYKTTGEVLMTFNLFDTDGNPAMEDVMKREKV